jgi:hypothetical protein
MRWMWRLCFCVLVAVSLPAQAQDTIIDEYKLKAAFVFNFTRYVDWPATRFENASSPIVIGVLQPNPFGSELENLVKGRQTNRRPIVVRQFATIAAARSAHVLFVGSDAEESMVGLPKELAAYNVLTVGESESFLKDGGIIIFSFEGNSLRFEIDQRSAEQARLQISAQLYKLAKSVRK